MCTNVQRRALKNHVNIQLDRETCELDIFAGEGFKLIRKVFKTYQDYKNNMF